MVSPPTPKVNQIQRPQTGAVGPRRPMPTLASGGSAEGGLWPIRPVFPSRSRNLKLRGSIR